MADRIPLKFGYSGADPNSIDELTSADNAKIPGTIEVTGHTKFEGVTSTGATGTGKIVYDTGGTTTNQTLVTPALGTPASGTLANCTGYPSASTTVTGISELATTDETITGTDTARTTTPAGVAGAMAVQTNPKAMAQGIHMTYVASGSTGIAVADDNDIDVGTSNYTLGIRLSVPDWTPSNIAYLLVKQGTGPIGYYLSIDTSGTFTFVHDLRGRGGANIGYTSTISNTFVNGTEHEVTAVVTRETASVAGSVYFYVDGNQFGDAIPITAGVPLSLDNDSPLYISGDVSRRVDSINKSAHTFNRALSASEVLDLYRNGIAFADKWGSQTEQTSGTLTAGKRYRINNWITDDDFTNVGGTNEDGNEFIATGTTPTKWTNSSTVVPAGATLDLEPEGIQPAPGQWLDSSSNKLHAMQPATGSSLIRKKDTFEVRWTNTWAGTHEAQYIGGVNQAVLPANCYIESIIGVVSGATVEDIIIGDGSDTDRWVAATTGLAAGTTSFTIANHISDGTNYKLVVDPDANFTGSIAWTIKGIILQ